ncbi:helix-turn-helix domain-containing protein [Modestobacter muralis]|uniref:Helix-turn-helix domain-containing protein n=1 Tax=Modestobacter muralis TaxID=1608614 RepID=A0A6P0H7X2_9ACTN|nr:helix-turn-helix domain-containing protein [Modestobacter muralis]NEK95090.1 helix-turn-helix domain-containing protein [Modestobacter muralis]NEN51978.1 helix-turn-helix domain-containing protein [Modestobacter muralis]
MPEDTPAAGRDRLRELLDAVLDEDNRTLSEMAGDAFASPWHFSRQVSRGAGEAPVALRRRVVLERAAWQLRQGRSVTDVAFAAGYESVEGFSRAFTRAHGRTPGQRGTAPARDAHWLPAPNGIHFHPPASLWVAGQPGQRGGDEVTALLVHHDLEDTRALLETATGLPEEEYRRVRVPGQQVLAWDGPEESLAAVLEHQVWSTEMWLAAVEGADHPVRGRDDPASLLARHDEAAPRWLAFVREVSRRGAWGDRLVDALCDPPESFVLGSVVAHVLTYGAHRRQLARHWFRAAGLDVDAGDPIDWLRRRTS